MSHMESRTHESCHTWSLALMSHVTHGVSHSTRTRDMTRAGAEMMSYMETRWRRSDVIHGDSHS